MNRLLRLPAAALFAAWVALAPRAAFAHGEMHEQIASIDRQISAQPEHAELYLRRAELRRMHREWDAAERDYAQAIKLDPALTDVLWLRARSLLEAGKPAAALSDLDVYVAQFPNQLIAQLTRARTLAALGRNGHAAFAYASLLERLPQPQPDYYVEQWNAQQAAGHSPAAQLVALEKGLLTLGSVPVLEDAALGVELRAKQWDAALARLDRQSATAARKERWLYRRGLVLAEANRNDQAAIAFGASLDQIDRLPPGLRGLRATASLAEQVRESLAKLRIERQAARDAGR